MIIIRNNNIDSCAPAVAIKVESFVLTFHEIYKLVLSVNLTNIFRNQDKVSHKNSHNNDNDIK